MYKATAIVIGSGIAGIAAAIRLAVQGFEVSIYEKNNYSGGKLTAFEKDGYHFDAGPSLFTQPLNIEELFEIAGERIEDYISWQKVPVSCKYFYENGKTVLAYTDAEKFSEEMANQLNESPATIKKYLKRSAKLYDNIGSFFLENSLHKRSTWLRGKFGLAVSTLRPAYLFKSLNNFNRAAFKSPEAVQLFNRFATYNGSNPYKAPAMLSIIPHLEINQGTYYPAGGMISITNALVKLAKAKGVHFYFNAPVTRIIHHAGKAKGVVVNNKNIIAEVVLSNVDAYFTYKNLLVDYSLSKKVLKHERSSSAVIFYWGIKKEFSQLHLHNIFFSKDYATEFHEIFNRKQVSADPTVYVNITSKMEAFQAPAGKENWFLLINAPYNDGQPWEDIKIKLRTTVINKLSAMLGEPIEPLIETEEISDPLMIESQTASYKGSLYGTSSNSKLSAFLRHPNFSSTIKGLYFCGGSVHPGGGIPLCLKSAKIASELIKEDYKQQREH